MSSSVPPLKICQVQYQPKPPKPQSLKASEQKLLKAEITPRASEVMAQDQLDQILAQDYPEVQRFLLLSPQQGNHECLLINQKPLPALQRDSPEQPLPRLNSDLFSKQGMQRALDQAEVLQIEHADGNIVNNRSLHDNLENLVDEVRHPQTETQPTRNRHKKFQRPVGKSHSKPLAKKNPPADTAKNPFAQAKPHKAQPSASANKTEDEVELMFNLEL